MKLINDTAADGRELFAAAIMHSNIRRFIHWQRSWGVWPTYIIWKRVVLLKAESLWVGFTRIERRVMYSYRSALEMPSLLENGILPVVRNLTNGGGIRLIETCLGVINGDLGASQK